MANSRVPYPEHEGDLVRRQPFPAVGLQQVEDTIASRDFTRTPSQLPTIDGVGLPARVARRLALTFVSHVTGTGTAERELHQTFRSERGNPRRNRGARSRTPPLLRSAPPG